MAEKAFQEEKAQLQLLHNEELRQLRSQVGAKRAQKAGWVGRFVDLFMFLCCFFSVLLFFFGGGGRWDATQA